jgi:3-hydroxyacyl-[acyl-carrier-protein] dehydratase
VDSKTLGRDVIEARIPHRAPFLFVDVILDEDETTITTEWTPPSNAEFFNGHYPGNPIVPGVLLMEFAFQSAALWFAGRAAAGEAELEDTIPVLTRVSGGRFKRMTGPGQTVRAELELTEALGPARFMTARLKNSAGKLIVALDFAVAAAPRPAPDA